MEHVFATAWFLGPRIDVRGLEGAESLAVAPLIVRTGRAGRVAVFRFGAVVCFDLDEREQADFIAGIASRVVDPFPDPESESLDVGVDPVREERVYPGGELVLHEVDTPRLQVVAHALAKSTVLAHYEERLALVFDRIESLAEGLHRGAGPARGRELLRELGDVLLIQTATVGRAEVTEKPEITWDDPALDRLYERLAVEYELRDRDVALARKLQLVSETAETYLELLHNRRAIRVEWYIVALIAVEIVLILYDIFVH